MKATYLKTLPFLFLLSSCQSVQPTDITDNSATDFPPAVTVPFAESRELTDLTLANIREIAQKDFPQFVDRLGDGTIQGLGFTSRQELLSAAIGPAIPMLSLNTTGNYQECQGIWRLPLIINGQMRSLLTVSEVNGQKRLVDMGGAELAGKIEQVTAAYGNLLSGKRYYILRSHQLGEDFLGPIEIQNKFLTNKKLAPISGHNPLQKSGAKIVDLEQLVKAATEVNQ